MGRPIKSYITFKGQPLCRVDSEAWRALFGDLKQECSFRSLNQAWYFRKSLEEHVWWKTLRIVRGTCPEGHTVLDQAREVSRQVKDQMAGRGRRANKEEAR